MIAIVKKLDDVMDRYRSDTPQLTPLVGPSGPELFEERSREVREMDLRFTRRNRSKSAHSTSSASQPPPTEPALSDEEVEKAEEEEDEGDDDGEPEIVRRSARSKGKGRA